MNSFIDSHCHLNFPQFKDNLDEIIKRATNSGVKKMITISIKLSQINDLEYISNKYSQVYNSVGIHPHECINYKDLSIDDLHNVANSLLDLETITGKQMEKIIKGNKTIEEMKQLLLQRKSVRQSLRYIVTTKR